MTHRHVTSGKIGHRCTMLGSGSCGIDPERTATRRRRRRKQRRRRHVDWYGRDTVKMADTKWTGTTVVAGTGPSTVPFIERTQGTGRVGPAGRPAITGLMRQWHSVHVKIRCQLIVSIATLIDTAGWEMRDAQVMRSTEVHDSMRSCY